MLPFLRLMLIAMMPFVIWLTKMMTQAKFGHMWCLSWFALLWAQKLWIVDTKAPETLFESKLHILCAVGFGGTTSHEPQHNSNYLICTAYMDYGSYLSSRTCLGPKFNPKGVRV